MQQNFVNILRKNIFRFRTGLIAYGVISIWFYVMLVLLAVFFRYVHQQNIDDKWVIPNSVFLWKIEHPNTNTIKGGQIISFPFALLDTLKNHIPKANVMAGGYYWDAVCKTNWNELPPNKTQIIGISQYFSEIYRLEMQYGRLFDTTDYHLKRLVCIVNGNTANVLFESATNALDKFVNIDGNNFRVVGIFNEKKSYLHKKTGAYTLVVPLPTVHAKMGGDKPIDKITIIAGKGYSAQVVSKLAIETLNKHCKSHEKFESIYFSDLKQPFRHTNKINALLLILIFELGIFLFYRFAIKINHYTFHTLLNLPLPITGIEKSRLRALLKYIGHSLVIVSLLQVLGILLSVVLFNVVQIYLPQIQLLHNSHYPWQLMLMVWFVIALILPVLATYRSLNFNSGN